ncbi:hypothetical protein F5Y04DRAFT_283320 [Hypomontagnella monticulosa]|nr:hypothetical protein F5Y04DRAFT_283320 [Hypomontagnella monticulosa]
MELDVTMPILATLRHLFMAPNSVGNGRKRGRVKKWAKRSTRCTKNECNKIAEQVEMCLATKQLAREYEIRRQESIEDGREFLKDFVRYYFREYVDHIRIISTLTFEEIKMIGNEQDQAYGVQQCRRLFNALVLSDQVGHLLWCELRKGRHDFRILLESKYGSESSFNSFD